MFDDSCARAPFPSLPAGITPEAGMFEATNPLFEELFAPVDELYEAGVRQKTITQLLIAR